MQILMDFHGNFNVFWVSVFIGYKVYGHIY